MECKRLEKVLDPQIINTDSLVQEITLWEDVIRVYEQFNNEFQVSSKLLFIFLT